MAGNERDISTYVEVDGREYLLGRDQDLAGIMSKIEAAARSEAAFVDLSVNDPYLSVLISHRSRVVISTRQESPAQVEFVAPGALMGDWDV